MVPPTTWGSLSRGSTGYFKGRQTLPSRLHCQIKTKCVWTGRCIALVLEIQSTSEGQAVKLVGKMPENLIRSLALRSIPAPDCSFLPMQLLESSSDGSSSWVSATLAVRPGLRSGLLAVAGMKEVNQRMKAPPSLPHLSLSPSQINNNLKFLIKESRECR